MQPENMDFLHFKKYTAAIRQLAYGAPADHYDLYIRIGESTVIKYLSYFFQCIIEIYGAQYLRRLNSSDVE